MLKREGITRIEDYGLDPIQWEACPTPKAGAVLEWLQQECPEIIKQMEAGIEPGFGKIKKCTYRKLGFSFAKIELALHRY